MIQPALTEPVSFGQAVRFWFWLGCVSFGGPAGQIAVMHAELVERRRWISERRFLHALNYCMVLPGPEAQQLATYIGWLLHGTKGGIVAGGLFILPSLLLLMGLSALYVAFGTLPLVAAVLDGVKPAVVAIVLAAVIRVGRRAIRNSVMLCFAIGAFLALTVLKAPFPLVLLVAGVLGWIGSRIWPTVFTASGHGGGKRAAEAPAPAVIDDHHPPPPHAQPRLLKLALLLVIGLTLWGGPLLALTLWQGAAGPFTRMGWLFTKSALVTFGGAYAVLPYVAEQAVEVNQWLTAPQMVDGLALGETTPGPLIMVVSFVGFVGGWNAGAMGWIGAILGCLIATWFTFLPSFVFILGGAPYIEQMREELRLSAALSGITAAVVGVVLNLAVYFGRTVFLPAGASGWLNVDWFAVGLAAAAFTALMRFNLGLGYLIALCGAAGLVRAML
jgi:chromate transporter